MAALTFAADPNSLNNMKKQILCILAVIGAALPSCAADGDAVIFSGEDGFRSGWTVTAWGGLEARKDAEGENGGLAAASVLTEKAVPFSGVSLRVGYDQNMAAAAIPLDETLRDRGIVVLKVNCGKDSSGQALQANLGFLVEGKMKEAPQVPLGEFGGPAKLDNDPETWQEIRIPIDRMLAKLPDPTAAEGLLSVGIQYVDAPVSEILVGDCRITTE